MTILTPATMQAIKSAVAEINERQRERGHVLLAHDGTSAPVMTPEEMFSIIVAHLMETKGAE